MFQSFKQGAAKLGANIKEGAEAAKEKTLNTMDKHRLQLDNFKTGNIVVLISRTSASALQKVGDTVNGKGKPDSDNAKWTIVDMGNHTCRLHNGHDFLAIVDGTTKLIHFDDSVTASDETHFKLQNHEQFVSFESNKTDGHHVGILSDGELKPALATGKENDSHFAVKMIHDAHPEAAEECQ